MAASRAGTHAFDDRIGPLPASDLKLILFHFCFRGSVPEDDYEAFECDCLLRYSCSPNDCSEYDLLDVPSG